MNVEGISISIPVEFIQKRCPAMLGFFKEVLESWRRVSMRLNGKNSQILTVSCQKS